MLAHTSKQKKIFDCYVSHRGESMGSDCHRNVERATTLIKQTFDVHWLNAE